MPTRWLSLTIMTKNITASVLPVRIDTDNLSSSGTSVSGSGLLFCQHLGLTWITSAVSNFVFPSVKGDRYVSSTYDQFLMVLLLHLVDKFIISVGMRKMRKFLHSKSSSRDVNSKRQKKHMTPNSKSGLHCVILLLHKSLTRCSSQKVLSGLQFSSSSLFFLFLKLDLYVVSAALKLNTKQRMTLNLVLLLPSLPFCMLTSGLYSSEALFQGFVQSRQALH